MDADAFLIPLPIPIMQSIADRTARPRHLPTNSLLKPPICSDCTIENPPAPGMVYAPDIWNRIIASAHKYAEPGIIFIDEVNRHNHMMNSMGPIYACNPCVTADTLVYTDEGLIPMGELYNTQKDFDAVVDARYGYENTFHASSKAFKTGVKEVFRLDDERRLFASRDCRS